MRRQRTATTYSLLGEGFGARQLLFAVIAVASGLVLNLVPLPLFFGVDFLLGSVITLVFARVAGLVPVMVVAALISAPTLALWGHPWAIAIFTAEAAFVALAQARYRSHDLTLIDVVRTFGNVTLYTTGISVQPAFGWYFDLVPRSSLSKTGHAVANSVGVIDRTYTGPIMVALVRLDPSAPELELPARVVQIVPRPIVHVHLEEVDELDETARGAGGFGSTG